jgi:hypothetical protein
VSTPLKAYPVVCFDAVNKLVTADWIEAASDEEAVTIAQASDFGSKCELWQGRRLVAQLEAERRQA